MGWYIQYEIQWQTSYFIYFQLLIARQNQTLLPTSPFLLCVMDFFKKSPTPKELFVSPEKDFQFLTTQKLATTKKTATAPRNHNERSQGVGDDGQLWLCLKVGKESEPQTSRTKLRGFDRKGFVVSCDGRDQR